MTERMVPVPESLVMDAVAVLLGRDCSTTAEALRACLPGPEPTFSDEEALAFYRAVMPGCSEIFALRDGRNLLSRLLDAKWTAPKALCPPPSPALVELVEAARRVGIDDAWASRLRAAVAAYDEQEG